MDNFNLRKYLAEGKLNEFVGKESLNESKMPTQDQVDKFFALTQNEMHYLNSKPVAGQEKTFNKMEVKPWDEYDLSNFNALVRKAKSKGKLNEFVGKELEDRNEPLYDKLVAGSGKSDTVEGEMLRAINRIVYRYYNDGDEYNTGYGIETAGPAHSFLVNANHPLRSLVSTLFKNGTNYEQTIKDVLDAILDHIESRQGKYTSNSEDMFDYEPEFEFEEEEEDYDDDYDDDYDEFDNEEQY